MRAVREAVRSGARAGMTSYNEIAEMLNAKGHGSEQVRWADATGQVAIRWQVRCQPPYTAGSR
jgi:hypothetical protein